MSSSEAPIFPKIQMCVLFDKIAKVSKDSEERIPFIDLQGEKVLAKM